MVSGGTTSLHVIVCMLTAKRAVHTQLDNQLHHVQTKTDLVLAPSLIEDHVHDNAGEATVVLNHAYQLPFKLLLLCM